MTPKPMPAIKESPILFNGEMVRAILGGQKTQTRRCNKLDEVNVYPDDWHYLGTIGHITPGGIFHQLINEKHKVFNKKCPYGKVGAKLWVRETWQAISPDENWRPYEECKIIYKTTDEHPGFYAPEYAEVYNLKQSSPVWDMDQVFPWKPSIHMPRWASRLTLEITDIRVERVQNISESDAEAEGIWEYEKGNWKIYTPTVRFGTGSRVESFKSLWDSINSNWDANPWVWALTFKVV